MRSLTFALLVALMLCISTTAHGQAEPTIGTEALGALKGSMAQSICNIAWKYHEKHLSWPVADTLTHYSGLEIHNLEYNTRFVICVLDKPNDPLPEGADKTRTFAVCFFYSTVDSSRYVQCSIYYEDGSRPFTDTMSEGEAASIWSIQADVQTAMLKFLGDLSDTKSDAEMDSLAIKYSEELSNISPRHDPRAKQLLYDLCHEVFLDVSVVIPELDRGSGAYQIELDGYSYLIAKYIFHQEWKQH